jgi:hypothetical protein
MSKNLWHIYVRIFLKERGGNWKGVDYLYLQVEGWQCPYTCSFAVVSENIVIRDLTISIAEMLIVKINIFGFHSVTDWTKLHGT